MNTFVAHVMAFLMPTDGGWILRRIRTPDDGTVDALGLSCSRPWLFVMRRRHGIVEEVASLENGEHLRN